VLSFSIEIVRARPLSCEVTAGDAWFFPVDLRISVGVRTVAAAVAAAAASLIISSVGVVAPARAAVGFHVSDGRLVEANGATFIIRGTNLPYVYFPRNEAFADIKALGANAVRVVLSGGRWKPNGVDDVATVVSACKVNRLICILDDHDPSGYLQDQNEWSLDRAADYWISVQSALLGQEDYVLINLGNEPYFDVAVNDWPSATQAAIQKLRNAGLHHTVIVDGPNTGQDWQFVMRDNARTVFDSDPEHNTVFSVHMYSNYDTPDKVISYLDSFQGTGMPLIVGEFGDKYYRANPDVGTIMAQAVSRGIGYLGWCWSGFGSNRPEPYLDQVVDFDPNQLTSWGERLFNGENGIRATAAEGTVYG
jgi:mannan endo-1,4-beta-mannosidase